MQLLKVLDLVLENDDLLLILIDIRICHIFLFRNQGLDPLLQRLHELSLLPDLGLILLDVNIVSLDD